jgi:hypothetical protein
MNKQDLGELFDKNFDVTYETAISKEVTPVMSRKQFIEVVYELTRNKTVEERLNECRKWALTDEELKELENG